MTRDQRQELCISKWKQAGGRGILELCTGFGKTRCSLKIIRRLVNKKQDAKIIIIVPTEYLKSQWLLQLADWNLMFNCEILIINSAVGKQKDCDLLIVDEVHEAMNDNRITIFKDYKYKLCLGLTATIERIDSKHHNLIKYMPIVDTITYEEALRNDWVAKVNEYKVLLTVDLEEYHEAHKDFLHHFAFFNYDFDMAMATVGNANAQYEVSRILQCSPKEVMIHAMQFIKALTARKTFVLNHFKKVEVARLILEHRRDKKVITFSQTKKMAESIGEGLLMHSGQTKKVRDQIMAQFNAMEMGVLNSAKQLERGADIFNLSVAINLAFNSAKNSKKQKSGRVGRKEGDKESEFFTLVIKGTMEEAWYDKSMKGSTFITIDENQLVALLKGEEYKVQKHKEKQYLFTI